MKSLLLVTLATLGLTASTMSQNLPNYVPSNGLVGWWPFNGNANDESGINNNGTVYGATLTTDRFGNSANAYSFDGISNHIRVSDNNNNNNNSLDLVQDYSMSVWVNLTGHVYSPCIITKHLGNIDNIGTYTYLLSSQTANYPYYILQQATPHFDNSTETTVPTSYELNQWYNLSCTYNKSQQRLIHYINSIAVDTVNVLYDIQNTSIDLLFGATFIWDMNTLDYFWNGKIDDIGIWNRDLTSQEITDLFNSNSGITGFNSGINNNTIKIFPNPANDHVTIDNGNFATMDGYQLRIENSLGQQVFQTNINQQTDYLSLNNWGGNGLYFVHIIDAQGNTIDIRKIVLQ